MYDQAVAVVLQHRRASISLVQRHLRIGYNRAARLLEQMEKSGLVSRMATNGNRDILVPEARRMKRSHVAARRCCLLALRRAARADAVDTLRDFVRDVKSGRAELHADRDLARRREEEDLVAAASSSRGRTAFASPTPSRSSRRSSPTAQKVWIYDADLNQVSCARSAQALGATPAALLAGGSLDKDFDLAALPAADGLEWVQATPQGEGRRRSSRCASASRARTWRRSRSSTASASARCCASRRWSRTSNCADEQFRFTPPKGADVIQQ